MVLDDFKLYYEVSHVSKQKRGTPPSASTNIIGRERTKIDPGKS